MKIVYVLPGDAEMTVDVPAGKSLMQAALDAGVPGIVGECGGEAMCATCHVYLPRSDTSQFGAVGDEEDEMLDCTATVRTEQSRLSCQLVATEESGTDRVIVPERQR